MQQRGRRGFTLIDLIVVISIILVLVSIAAPLYEHHVSMAREAALKDSLQTLRREIQNFTEHKRYAPQSLDELVSEDYLSNIPNDPMTRRSDWVLEMETPGKEVDPQRPGI